MQEVERFERFHHDAKTPFPTKKSKDVSGG